MPNNEPFPQEVLVGLSDLGRKLTGPPRLILVRINPYLSICLGGGTHFST